MPRCLPRTAAKPSLATVAACSALESTRVTRAASRPWGASGEGVGLGALKLGAMGIWVSNVEVSNRGSRVTIRDLAGFGVWSSGFGI